MKQQNFSIKVVLSFMAFLLCIQCSPPNHDVTQPYKGSVVYLSGINPQGQAQYAIGPREFKYLTNLSELRGEYVRFYFGGMLRFSQVNGDFITPEKFEKGETPRLRYQTKSGVVVPQDYSSFVMLSAYYQFDQILEKMESLTGITPANYFSKGPADVLFEPSLEYAGNDSSLSTSVKLNAAFIPGQRQFILFDRSPIEKLPLAANLQVLAHEFGHSMFEYTFYKNNYDYYKNLKVGPWDWANSYALSGLNEGFADFYSYLNTNSTDVLGGSIANAIMAQERNFSQLSYSYDSISSCNASFYCLGSLFAKVLYQTRTNLTEGSQEQFGSHLVTALSKTLEYMDNVPPSMIVARSNETANENVSHPDLYDHATLNAFLYALVTSIRELDTSIASSFCSNLTRTFGIRGFSADARKACP